MTGNRAFVAIGLLVAGLSVLPAPRAEELQVPTLVVQAGIEVDAGGRVVGVELDSLDPELNDRHASGWRRDVRRGIARPRFKPEIIDGRPVPTVMELPITIVRSPSRAVTRDAIRESQGNAAVCQAAAGKAKNEAVAVDSRFELLPQG